MSANEASPRLDTRTTNVPSLPAGALRRAGLRSLAAAAYLVLMGRLGLDGPAHWLFAIVAVAVPVTIPPVDRILLGALPFVAFAAVYDLLKLAHPAVVASGVHVAAPYLFDKWAFGVGGAAARVSMNELFAAHHWTAVDLVTGCAYFSYIYAVLAFAVFVALIDRTADGWRRTRGLGWSFFGMNLAATATYLLLPVAPPWYVAKFGFGPVDVHTTASPGALVRWDALVGVPYFARFYAHCSDVFGAMPSMHCAYPMLLLLYARELRRPILTRALVAFELLMCFSAVYLQHHYVSDIVVGISFAFAAYKIERAVSGRAPA
ncbi:MAG TPA: phosphatase PAP2 family protein [Polyangia bacterium]|nr:phosphatase PAP2 family protein [Polyangia bacterium]